MNPDCGEFRCSCELQVCSDDQFNACALVVNEFGAHPSCFGQALLFLGELQVQNVEFIGTIAYMLHPYYGHRPPGFKSPVKSRSGAKPSQLAYYDRLSYPTHLKIHLDAAAFVRLTRRYHASGEMPDTIRNRRFRDPISIWASQSRCAILCRFSNCLRAGNCRLLHSRW